VGGRSGWVVGSKLDLFYTLAAQISDRYSLKMIILFAILSEYRDEHIG